LALDLGMIAMLLLLSVAIHAWLIRHTVVPARDGIDFLHYAWRLQHDPWPNVVRTEGQHPGYPLAVLALSAPWRSAAAEDCNAMARYAQVVNALASCLLVVPMFLLGRHLFDRQVGFWAALLFQCLPVSARATSDALSEGLFLLIVAMALLAAVHSLKSRSLVGFGVCGLFGGFAYLVRPEGVLVVLASALVLAVGQFVPAFRCPWKRAGGCFAALGVSAVLVGLPYALTIGRFTVKPTSKEILHRQVAWKNAADPSTKAVQCASVLGVWWSSESDPHGNRLGRSFVAVASEICRGFYYVGWLAALYGLFCYRKRLPATPGAWIVLALCLLHAAAIWRVASVKGYVSERHVLIIVMCGLLWTVLGIEDVASRLPAWVQKLPASRLPRLLPWSSAAGAWSVALPLGFAVSALPRTLQPLHANEAGHRAAGLWLAEHAAPEEVICDPFKWAGYYAGRAFQEDWDPSRYVVAARYVVLEGSREQHSKEEITERARELAQQGEVVYDWRPGRRDAQHKAGEVKVYRIAREGRSP
jgi:hypothetical protein